MIEPNNNARLKIENGFIVVEKAFQRNGVFHDIVVSNGDQRYQITDPRDKDLKERIQNVYAACLWANQVVQNTHTPASGIFVYAKTLKNAPAEITQTQVILPQSAQSFNIGIYQPPRSDETIDQMMSKLADSIGLIKEFTIHVPEPQSHSAAVEPAALTVQPSAPHYHALNSSNPVPANANASAPPVPPPPLAPHSSSPAPANASASPVLPAPSSPLFFVNTPPPVPDNEQPGHQTKKKSVKPQSSPLDPKVAKLSHSLQRVGVNGKQIVAAVNNKSDVNDED